MPDALDLVNNLTSVNIKNVLTDSFNEVSEVAADLNATQMAQGLRADGSEILPSYTDYTIEIKELKGQPTDIVTLDDTHAHYEGLYQEMKGDVYEKGSHDPKAEKLLKKYGKIYGLTDDSKDEFVHGYLSPTLQRNYTSLTGLKFN